MQQGIYGGGMLAISSPLEPWNLKSMSGAFKKSLGWQYSSAVTISQQYGTTCAWGRTEHTEDLGQASPASRF